MLTIDYTMVFSRIPILDILKLQWTTLRYVVHIMRFFIEINNILIFDVYYLAIIFVPEKKMRRSKQQQKEEED